MSKFKLSLLLVLTLVINFYTINSALAIQDTPKQCIHPDYAYIFTGKDKCEGFNRKLFVFNLKLNKCILKPINTAWASVMPKCAMDKVQNAYNNTNYPVRLIGSLMQKDYTTAKRETLRFLTNTTIGVGGLFDPAKNKFKIEPRDEDISQALAYRKVKQGSYLVLPVVHGNIRDLAGQLLACPLRPCSYAGPFAALANAVFFVNNTTYMQPLIKRVEQTYADPYEIVRQVDGVTSYIKNNNLDRPEVFLEKTKNQNIIKVNNSSDNPEVPIRAVISLTPDINLENFNSQGSLADSMRTALFESQNPEKNSIWSENSIWNHSFNKKIKTASINIEKSHPNYKYRYILQKKQTSPLAIIYPSFGEGINSDHSITLAKILFDDGYSVLIQGSAFQWEFVKSMPENYRPGLPKQDAENLRKLTHNIIQDIERKNKVSFKNKIMVGSSFGALTSLFVAAQEEKENTMDISKYIAINPPIDLFFAQRQLDQYSKDWQNDTSDIKLRTAITVEKTIQAIQKITDEKVNPKPETLPLNEEEAKLIIGFIMRQKLSDVVFAIDNCSRSKKNNTYDTVKDMSFQAYAQKYFFDTQEKTPDEYEFESSLYSVSDFLRNSQKYKIYHTADDYFANTEQLIWLKKQTQNKSIIFSNGSHLGFLYRKEFLDEFKKDINNIEAQDLIVQGGV